MQEILHTVGELDGIEMDSVSKAVLELYKDGKIAMRSLSFVQKFAPVSCRKRLR